MGWIIVSRPHVVELSLLWFGQVGWTGWMDRLLVLDIRKCKYSLYCMPGASFGPLLCVTREWFSCSSASAGWAALRRCFLWNNSFSVLSTGSTCRAVNSRVKNILSDLWYLQTEIASFYRLKTFTGFQICDIQRLENCELKLKFIFHFDTCDIHRFICV